MSDLLPNQLSTKTTTSTADIVIVQDNSTGEVDQVALANLIPAASITGNKVAANTITPDKMLGVDLFATYSTSLSGGTAPTAGTGQFYMQAGSGVVTMNSGGSSTVTFPVAFPNGVISVLAMQGDTTGGGNPITGVGGSYTTTQFSFTGLSANATVRINWIAIGY